MQGGRVQDEQLGQQRHRQDLVGGVGHGRVQVGKLEGTLWKRGWIWVELIVSFYLKRPVVDNIE